MSEEMERTYVTQLVGRAMYLRYAKYKGYNIKPWPYVDPGSQQYADTAVELLGYQPDDIPEIAKALEDF